MKYQMYVIGVRNVEEALIEGLQYLYQHGVAESSRAGSVMVSPVPVTTVYRRPMERVLFNLIRDANPFFHIMEALFYLAGRNDARWLDQFVQDFSSRFAEADGTLHGSYGFRWRRHFDMEGGGHPTLPDQLDLAVDLLRKNPKDRRVVITMWDPVADLGAEKRDVPCNLLVMPRIRNEIDTVGMSYAAFGMGGAHQVPYLDITVCCRSNDLIWGLAGSNAVQFSVLQEYLAARIGVGVGTYTQISNNYHAYTNVLDKLEEKAILEHGVNQLYDGHVEVTPIVTAPEYFDLDLGYFFSGTPAESGLYSNEFFPQIALPLYAANRLWKAGDRQKALREIAAMPPRADWRRAAYEWFSRRAAVKGLGT